MVYSALSDDASTVSQFTRRKNITVTTNGTNTPANYQVKFTITYESEMQVDFDDIRFNTLSGEYIDYWIESYTNSTTADIWIELPNAINDPSSDTIWMYYGNAFLSDDSNGVNTFITYDIFDTLNSWTLTNTPTLSTTEVYYGTNSVRINADSETFYRNPNSIGIYSMMLHDNGDTSSQEMVGHSIVVSSAEKKVMLGIYTPTSTTHYVYRYDGTLYASGITRSVGWHELKIVLTGSQSILYVDDNLIDTRAYDPGTENNHIIEYGDFWGGNVGIGYFDQYTVRKYIANEPTPSYGTAQHQRKTPIFIG